METSAIAREFESIKSDVKALQKELANLKSHLIDIDLVLTDDDKKAIEKADKEFKERKTKRLI